MYRLSGRLPADERFGLVSQLRTAATSVPTNIGEGSKRRSNAEYAWFLNVAEGSLAETNIWLLSRDLRFLKSEAFDALLKEVSDIARMLNALRLKLEAAI